MSHEPRSAKPMRVSGPFSSTTVYPHVKVLAHAGWVFAIFSSERFFFILLGIL
jgi:hypothetical protein